MKKTKPPVLSLEETLEGVRWANADYSAILTEVKRHERRIAKGRSVLRKLRPSPLRDRDGEFEGRSRERRMALLGDLERLADSIHMTGITMTLNNAAT